MRDHSQAQDSLWKSYQDFWRTLYTFYHRLWFSDNFVTTEWLNWFADFSQWQVDRYATSWRMFCYQCVKLVSCDSVPNNINCLFSCVLIKLLNVAYKLSYLIVYFLFTTFIHFSTKDDIRLHIKRIFQLPGQWLSWLSCFLSNVI